MANRRPNPRLAKIHRNYTVVEIADLFGVHKNTVREWIKQGLPITDDKRPMLILGRDLAAFLWARRKKNKRPCGPGELYCVRCRTPKAPAGDMLEYRPLTEILGNLIAICPHCGTIMNRRISSTKLMQIPSHLQLTMAQAPPRIGEGDQPSVNSDLG